MKTGLICGAEEPLASNPYLSAFNEEEDLIDLATFSVPTLCRYNFLPTEPKTRQNTLFVQLLKEITLISQATPHWVCCWSHDPVGYEKYRCYALLSRFRREGWATHVNEGIGIALRKLPSLNLPSLNPFTESNPSIGWAIVLSNQIDISCLTGPAFSPTFRVFSASHRIAPSRRFLEAMDWSLLYETESQTDDLGVVLVSKGPLDLDPMSRRAIVTEIVRGPAAPLVWGR